MRRLDLKCGFSCNNNCMFCVQADSKFHGNRPFGDLVADLKSARPDCDGIVLTGGEVTIRSDFLDLVKSAKDLGYEKIQIQTNGRMFSSLEFCRRTISAGANEFSPAIHGCCAEQHDSLTRARGSWSETVKGIRNLKQLGQYVITNTVVVKPNYRDLPKIANLLVRLGVDQFQFAFVHPMGNAWKNAGLMVPKKSDAIPYIKEGLDIGIASGIQVMAEAIPLCLMEGYESYVAESAIPETMIRGTKMQNTDDFAKDRKESGKTKFKRCKSCSVDSVCEGPWREYPELFGEEEFTPR